MKIYESKGTPSIVREIFNDMVNDINRVLSLKESIKLFLVIDKSIIINNNKKFFKSNLIIDIKFSEINNYTANINFKSCIDSNFENCIININTPYKIDKIKFYKSLLHELTHLYELYQIKDTFQISSWIKAINLSNFDSLELNSLSSVRYFRDLYYVSLPHEVRATLSSIEIFLISLLSKDDKILKSELENTTEWSRYIAIRDFDPINYTNNLISDYGISQVIRIFNVFNKVNNIKFSMKNENDILKYFKGYKRYFNDISNKMLKKITKKINEISNKIDNDILYLTETVSILPYDEYFNNKVEKRDIKMYELFYPDIKNYLIK